MRKSPVELNFIKVKGHTGVFVQGGCIDVKPALPRGFKCFSCMCTDA